MKVGREHTLRSTLVLVESCKEWEQEPTIVIYESNFIVAHQPILNKFVFCRGGESWRGMAYIL